MSTVTIQDHRTLLAELADLVSNRHPATDADALLQFATSYLDQLDTPCNQPVEELYRTVLACWQFIHRLPLAAESNTDWQTQLRQQGGETVAPYRFPSAYREHFDVDDALTDIALIQSLGEGCELASRFADSSVGTTTRLQFKLISAADSLVLSDVVPMLENHGVRVVSEHPYPIYRGDQQRFWLHDFTLVTDRDTTPNERSLALFRDCFDASWRGEAENDAFNRLVLSAGLTWRQIAVLRAYARYLRQTRFGFSQPFIAEVLVNQRAISRQLVSLFEQRFDPRLSPEATATGGLEAAILEALEQVENLDEDRIIRRYLELISATLRTNYFQRDPNGRFKSHLSFKFDPSAISDLPRPRPKYEIFVYSPRVEGVHLRAGQVARGGLRWSDRSEDYRTEVLGLVKAQQVKNSVIVPMGAKGCFVAKQLPSDGDREQVLAEGIACYQTYIRGLLDITDNLVAGEVVPPREVVRYDGDDPYLVVAADKGTASFSDIANAIAEEYSFWLGDAFASGGSQGYDHKKMGITAKGAWESVKRHFREQGLDTQSQPFTVIGIGDMAGDVFGNGMLLSETIELVAAFNHLHIFIDPNPNAAGAYTERQRLFNLPRSAWSDYDSTLISAGGGVFSRRAKRIAITPEMRTRFAIDADFLTPDQLINALLKAPVDMLWNGGIGTYIKAAHETHPEVGDKANDNVRVNGAELRCKVLGEGGNLGATQHGRIEFGLNGGGSNTDFIDNAGGVDCSDHEVNIKILLNEEVAAGRLTTEDRNHLLKAMTEEVSQLVLRNNYRQVQALSIASQHAQSAPDEYIHLIDSLEDAGTLDRALECLPERKTLLERRDQGQSLTRPELSVLISYTKIELKQALINSWVTDDPYLARELETAFPRQLLQRFPDAVRAHRLRREITATQIANDLVNRMGITFLHQLRKATGADHAQVAAAYLIAREVYGIERRWQAIEALDNRVPAATQMQMMRELTHLITRASWWLLRRRRHALCIQSCIDSYRAGIEQTVASVDSLNQTIPANARWQERFEQYVSDGVPELLAAYVAASQGLYWLLDIIEAASEVGRDVAEVSPVYFRLGEVLNLPWLDRQIRTYQASSHWQALARNSYRDDLDAQQRHLTISALRDLPLDTPADAAIADWTSKHAEFIERWHALLGEMQSLPVVDCVVFTVAINVLCELS